MKSSLVFHVVLLFLPPLFGVNLTSHRLLEFASATTTLESCSLNVATCRTEIADGSSRPAPQSRQKSRSYWQSRVRQDNFATDCLSETKSRLHTWWAELQQFPPVGSRKSFASDSSPRPKSGNFFSPSRRATRRCSAFGDERAASARKSRCAVFLNQLVGIRGSAPICTALQNSCQNPLTIRVSCLQLSAQLQPNRVFGASLLFEKKNVARRKHHENKDTRKISQNDCADAVEEQLSPFETGKVDATPHIFSPPESSDVLFRSTRYIPMSQEPLDITLTAPHSFPMLRCTLQSLHHPLIRILCAYYRVPHNVDLPGASASPPLDAACSHCGLSIEHVSH